MASDVWLKDLASNQSKDIRRLRWTIISCQSNPRNNLPAILCTSRLRPKIFSKDWFVCLEVMLQQLWCKAQPFTWIPILLPKSKYLNVAFLPSIHHSCCGPSIGYRQTHWNQLTTKKTLTVYPTRNDLATRASFGITNSWCLWWTECKRSFSRTSRRTRHCAHKTAFAAAAIKLTRRRPKTMLEFPI